MKLLFISLLLISSTVAMARSSTLRTRMSDDGKTLSIRIDGNQNGRKIHFDRIFDVSNMNRLQKEMLKYRVFNSLGVSIPLHELAGLIFTALGVVVVFFTGLMLRFRPARSARMKTVSGNLI